MRRKASHKGENGKVLIIGGSKDYAGAPALAGLGALKAGADLVKVAAPEQVAWSINSYGPDLITHKCKGEYLTLKNKEELEPLIAWADVIVIGNGMTQSSDRLITQLLKDIEKPKVIDAQAAKICPLTVKNAVLTPHKEEFKAFLAHNKLDEKRFEKDTKQFLKDNVLLVKGVPDHLYHKGRHVTLAGGNAGLTKGGTGDVLAGMIAGHIAQGATLLAAARKASQELKATADRLYKQEVYGYLASQLT